jgi:hypothetical protein
MITNTASRIIARIWRRQCTGSAAVCLDTCPAPPASLGGALKYPTGAALSKPTGLSRTLDHTSPAPLRPCQTTTL